MKEFRQIGDGTNGASWFENVLAQITLILSFYVFPYILTGCLAVLALLYLVIWVSAGFSVVFWMTVLVYVVLLGGSVGLWYLVQNPQLSWFQKLPFLYQAVQKLDWGFGWLRRFHGMLFIEAKRITPILVKKKKQLALWAGRKFWALPLKTKLAVTGVVVLTLVPAMLLVSVRTYVEVKNKLPYGANRMQLTDAEVEERTKIAIQAMDWAVWGQSDIETKVACMDQYRELIYWSAQQHGISRTKFEALIFVESGCDAKAYNSDSGAAGLAQILVSTGRELGLIDSAYKIQPPDKADSKKDRRYDPNFAIPAAAKFIASRQKYWGDEILAFEEYHLGQGNFRVLISTYLDETNPNWREKYPKTFSQTADPDRVIPRAMVDFKLTYFSIFFRRTPKHTPKTSAFLLKKSDFTTTYIFSILSAEKGFALKASDSAEFAKFLESQREPSGDVATNRFRTAYADKEATYNTVADLEKAISRGEIVPVPLKGAGYSLRVEGNNPIGECDLVNQKSYLYTWKSTAGQMMYLTARMKELGAQDVEITGLVRTNKKWYEPVNGQKACLPNTQPRTHVIGAAFDIGININGKRMSKKTEDILRFMLSDMLIGGQLSWIPEGKAFHVVVMPDAAVNYEQVYDSVMSGASPLVITAE